MIRRLLFALALLWPSLTFGQATNVWITQAGAGTQTGTTLGNAAPVTFMSNNANCGSGALQVGPGTTIHMSGTFTFAQNTTGIVFMSCSGTPGNKIWIKGEPGSICQSPQFGWSVGSNTGGCIQSNGNNYLKIGGATPCGTINDAVDSPNSCDMIIKNTAWGTAFPNPNINTQTGLLMIINCIGCEVSGVELGPVYLNTGHIALSTVTWTGSGNGSIVCAASCTYGNGIQIAIAGNSSVTSTTILTVTGTTNSTTFTVSGGPTSGGASGGTAYDETQRNVTNLSHNLQFVNNYSTSFSGPPGTGNNWDCSIHDSKIHDGMWMVFASPAGTNRAMRINNNQFYNFDHGWFTGPSDSVTGTGPISFDHNHLHDTFMWADGNTLDSFHCDPIHMQVDITNNPQDFFNDLYFWDNRFDGDMDGSTNYIFERASTTNHYEWNNVFGASASYADENAIVSIGDECDWNGGGCVSSGGSFSFTNTPYFLYNTGAFAQVFAGPSDFIHWNESNGAGTSPTPTHGLTNVTEIGNIENNGRNPVAADHGGNYTDIDYNMTEAVCADANTQSSGSCGGATRPYAGPNAGTYASCSITGVCDPGAGSSTPTWQTELGSACLSGLCAQHNLIKTFAAELLNANGSPQSLSPAIGAGQNLYSTYNGASWPLSQIVFDIAGNPRPSSGAWTIGAYQLSGSGPCTTGPCTNYSPNSLTFGGQPVGVPSSGQTITLTNVGSVTLNITSIVMQSTGLATGTNFSTSTTCGSTLTAGNSCSLTTIFDPTVVGSLSDNIVVTSNAPSNPDLLPVSGTGFSLTLRPVAPCARCLMTTWGAR